MKANAPQRRRRKAAGTAGTPQPPKRFTPVELAMWESVVAGLPPEWWFRTDPLVIELYVAHVLAGRAVARRLDAAAAGGHGVPGGLALMAADANAAVVAMSRQLGLPPP